MSLLIKKIASIKWEKENIVDVSKVSEEFEFISKELNSKKLSFTTEIKNLEKLVKNKENFQYLEAIDGNKLYLGDFIGVNFIAVISKKSNSSVLVVDSKYEKELSQFISFAQSRNLM